MKKVIIILIILFYILFLSDCTATYSNKNNENKIKYTGLVWVILDHYSIKKYHSNDKPKKWIENTVTLKDTIKNQ